MDVMRVQFSNLYPSMLDNLGGNKIFKHLEKLFEYHAKILSVSDLGRRKEDSNVDEL